MTKKRKLGTNSYKIGNTEKQNNVKRPIENKVKFLIKIKTKILLKILLKPY